MWCDFTYKNYYLLSKKQLINNNFLLTKMRLERKIIKKIPDIKYVITNTMIPKTKILEYSSSIFAYKKGIMQELKNLDQEVKIEWGNNIIYLKCTNQKLIYIKNRLNIFLKIITYLQGNIKTNITIFLILTNLKKQCDENKTIKPKHINSGYTDIIKKIIFIWREEEFEKVTFHELIHYFDKDHRNENYNNDTLKRYYEALTDTKAIYYNIIYISLLTKIKIKELLNLELNFINNQATYIQNMLNKKNHTITDAYSYYILKSKIFNYLVSSNISEDEYDNLFINHINGNIFLDKVFHNTINNIDYNNFNSARMTFLELA